MALDKIKTDVIADDAVTVAKVAADTGITDKYHKVPVYATDAARDHNTTGTGTPAAGMIIFNNAHNALQQYTGTEWSAIAPAPTFSGYSGNAFEGNMMEHRQWTTPLTEKVFENHTLSPQSYNGNTFGVGIDWLNQLSNVLKS